MICTYLNGLQLPVNPLEEIAFTVSTLSATYNIAELGEITELGNSKQKTFSIKSILTDERYSFSTGGKITVDDISDMIEAKQPVRFIITGKEAEINMLVSIDSFKYSIHYGEVKEYYYTLSLKEYREHLIKKVVAKNGMLTIPVRIEKQSTSIINSQKNGLSDTGDFKKKYADLAASTTFVSSNGGTHDGSSGGF